MKTILLSLVFLFSQHAFSWGELGHHVIGRNAARLAAADAELKNYPHGKLFADTVGLRWIQQGHAANLPDIHWKSADKLVTKLGNPTHYINLERFSKEKSPLATKVPLDYEEAKKLAETLDPELKFFSNAGTLPWRAQQLADLYAWALTQIPDEACSDEKKPHPTQVALAYAGLMAHKTGDASQPYHTTKDYDGRADLQRGLHAFFETDLVAVEFGLDKAVYERAQEMMTSEVPTLRKAAQAMNPKAGQEITAYLFALVKDSHSLKPMVRDVDRAFAVATYAEAEKIEACKNLPATKYWRKKYKAAKTDSAREKINKTKVLALAPGDRSDLPCRRPISTKLDGKGNPSAKGLSMAHYFRPFIVERLAIATAVTADIWLDLWKKAKGPRMCWTWQYVLKPSFLSPIDAKCFGYALKENREDFQFPEGNALDFPGVKTREACVRF